MASTASAAASRAAAFRFLGSQALAERVTLLSGDDARLSEAHVAADLRAFIGTLLKVHSAKRNLHRLTVDAASQDPAQRCCFLNDDVEPPGRHHREFRDG